MAAKIKRIKTLDVTLAPEAGALSRIFSAFREADVNVIACWGYEMGPKEALAHFHVTDATAAQAVLKKMSHKVAMTDAAWVEGDDKVGAYAEVLAKLAKAEVNITATDAFSIGNRFASVLFCEAEDYTKLCKALSI